MALDTSMFLRILMGEPERSVVVATKSVEAAAVKGDVLVCDLVVAECHFALQRHCALLMQQAVDRFESAG